MHRRRGSESQGALRYVMNLSIILLAFLLFISVVFVITHVRISKYFPIQTVKVIGLEHITPSNVETVLRPMVNKGFFAVNVDLIRDRILIEPWAADVFVQKKWPDRVEVTVVEKIPVARWNGKTLLSDAGILFVPGAKDVSTSLPVFVGPEGKHMYMLTHFNEMNRLLSLLHVKISYLELTPYMMWKIKLSNGVTLQLGHKDVLTRLGQFVKVYPKIVGDSAGNVDSIDLRYPNGVAVKWKKTAEPEVAGIRSVMI